VVYLLKELQKEIFNQGTGGIKLLNWIDLNKEWLLSGLGVALIGFLFGFIKWALSRKNETSTTKIAKSRGIISEGNVKGNISSGDQK